MREIRNLRHQKEGRIEVLNRSATKDAFRENNLKIINRSGQKPKLYVQLKNTLYYIPFTVNGELYVNNVKIMDAEQQWKIDSDFNGHALVNFRMPVVEKKANYTITADDYQVICTKGAFTVTLPTAAGRAGQEYAIKSASTGTITVDGNGAETIDGSTTQTLNQWDNLIILSDGSNWIIQ